MPIFLPFCLPIWAIERTPFEAFDQDPFGGRFAAYPYAGSAGGHIIPAPLGVAGGVAAPDPDDPFAQEPALGRYLHLRFSGEYAYDVDGAIHRPGGALLLDTSLRFGIESAWSVYVEPLAPNATDDLTFGDVNVFFRLAQDDGPVSPGRRRQPDARRRARRRRLQRHLRPRRLPPSTRSSST